jgi:hypothetical protein
MPPIFAGATVTSAITFAPTSGSLSVSEIIARVKKVFGDEADIQINSDDIMRWINDCIRDIAVEQNLLQAKATAATVLGQSEYTIPNDTLTLRAVKYNGIKLQAMSLGEAETSLPNFDDSANYPSGTPTHFWVFANRITLYPKPDAAGATSLEIYYTRQPAIVSSLSDVPEVPVPYHNRIVEYCLAQAYELDEDWNAANVKTTQFRTGIDKLKENENWVEHDVYPSILSTDTDEW